MTIAYVDVRCIVVTNAQIERLFKILDKSAAAADANAITRCLNPFTAQFG